ncbi:MAG: YciI family protein [Chloroflexota bacterium]
MTQEKRQFVYLTRAVDPAKAASRDNWTRDDEESFELHWARLEKLRDEGKLILAGRCQDADGSGIAITMIEVDSEEEAQRIFEEEPFIARGFASGTLHPFRVALSRNEV